MNAATAAFINTNIIVDIVNKAVADDVALIYPSVIPIQIYDIPLSSGGVINKIGNAFVNILLDFQSPKRVEHIVPFRP